MKKAILVVSFGTTYRDTREKNIEEIVRIVKTRYPEHFVEQAYTSGMVRKILKKRDNIAVPSMEEALDRMIKDGILQVTILPTHLIDGVESHKIKDAAETYKSHFEEIRMAGVLLQREEDYPAVAKALWDSVKEKAGNRIVIWMGHGSYHRADESYEKVEKAMRAYAQREIYIATVEGEKKLEQVIDSIQKNRAAEQDGTPSPSLLLTPLMLVAGDHATKDMAGETGSFYTKVTEAGFEAECLMKGLGEYEAIREIYLQHLLDAEKT